MKNVSVLALIMLSSFFSCTSPNRRVLGPDGTEYIKIECVDLEDCYERANKVCAHHRQVNMTDQSNETLKTILIQCE